MSDLYTDLAALDRDIADRWRTLTRHKRQPVLSAADIDYILADLNRRGNRTNITENQGKAVILLSNASLAADAEKSDAAIVRLIHYVNLWEEATHVIQDWQDVSSLAHHNEADTFIAEAVAELALYPDSPRTDDIAKASLVAAQMIVNKTAVDSNRDWQTAYENVVEAVARVYKLNDVRYVRVERGEGDRENTAPPEEPFVCSHRASSRTAFHGDMAGGDPPHRSRRRGLRTSRHTGWCFHDRHRYRLAYWARSCLSCPAHCRAHRGTEERMEQDQMADLAGKVHNWQVPRQRRKVE